MPAPIELIVQPSQFPQAVQEELLRSLRTRAINHKFHYDSYKQAHKWLAVHNAFSPACTDADCARIYDDGFRAAASGSAGKPVHLIGLGCGAGQKEARLLALLSQSDRKIRYTPMDVSAALVLAAASAARATLEPSSGILADLNLATDLSELLDSQIRPDASRILTFFGM